MICDNPVRIQARKVLRASRATRGDTEPISFLPPQPHPIQTDLHNPCRLLQLPTSSYNPPNDLI